MATVGEIGEQGLLERIQQWVAAPGPSVRIGIGDDAAVVTTAGADLVATVDILVEGVDFQRSYAPLNLVGRKAAAVNLSDLAAMGARPIGLLVALSVPADAAEQDVEALFAGLGERAGQHGAAILGGDLSEPPPGEHGWTISVTALGAAPEAGVVRRSGARAGDVLCVTGTLGDSALALRAFLAGETPDPQLARRHLDPEPRLETGHMLAGRAHAMIDISDGLAIDLQRLAHASGVGATVRLPDIPRSRAFGDPDGAAELLLAGGEDFELLFALAPETVADVTAASDVEVTVIGEVTEHPGLRILDADGQPIELSRPGWTHFSHEETES